MLRIANHINSSAQYVPLKQVNIEATIRSFAADVTITQIFRNDQSTSIVAVYYFPIEEQAAIYKFTARIDNREIIAQLKEKGDIHTDNSFGDHDEYRLEQDEQSQDNFIINLGALPSSKECIIIISYVTELDLIQGSIIRFVIPATIAPRYNPKTKNIISKKTKYVQSNPYRIEFRCWIEKINRPNQESYIARLTSPSHYVDIDLSLQDAYLVTFAQDKTYLDRDILLDIKLSDHRANTFVVVESNAAMAAVTPFEEDCYLTLNNNQTNEFIFIVDCSGSMRNENKIGLAREAMLFFLKNLPSSCYFNIIKFGTKYCCLFNQSTAFYSHVNVRVAEKFISEIRADLGGTEILAPLQWLERHTPPTNRFRQVFLLTDGQVANVSEVLELCRSMASSTRIFSFGLGASPSRSLIKGLARTTNGRFVFIPPNTSIDVYIEEQLQQAIRRCITNVRVEWNLGIPVENVPNQLSPAYINDRLIVYALTNNQTIPFNPKSSIEIRTDQSYFRLGVTDSDRITNNSQMIARLAAKALICELAHCKSRKQVRFQDIDNDGSDHQIIRSKKDIKRRMIDLSLKYNILSPYTVFVGIEKHHDRFSREIPIQLSNDNQDIRSFDSSDEQILPDSNIVSWSSAIAAPTDRYKVENGSLSRRVVTNGDIHWQQHSDDTSIVNIRDNTSETRLSNQYKPGEYQMSKEEVNISSMNDRDIVQYLVHQQTTDGLWNFQSNRQTIKDLTGKSLAVFQSSETHGLTQVLVTAIILILFETKFMTLRSMWEEAGEKARQRLIHLLDNDWKKLIVLFRNIRVILSA